jgi:hypothetical protein
MWAAMSRVPRSTHTSLQGMCIVALPHTTRHSLRMKAAVDSGSYTRLSSPSQASMKPEVVGTTVTPNSASHCSKRSARHREVLQRVVGGVVGRASAAQAAACEHTQRGSHRPAGR